MGGAQWKRDGDEEGGVGVKERGRGGRGMFYKDKYNVKFLT
jgi:hypothetical protein